MWLVVEIEICITHLTGKHRSFLLKFVSFWNQSRTDLRLVPLWLFHFETTLVYLENILTWILLLGEQLGDTNMKFGLHVLANDWARFSVAPKSEKHTKTLSIATDEFAYENEKLHQSGTGSAMPDPFPAGGRLIHHHAEEKKRSKTWEIRSSPTPLFTTNNHRSLRPRVTAINK